MDIENRASIVKDNVPSQNVENSRAGKIKNNSSARKDRVALSPYAQLSSSQSKVEQKALQRRSLREDFQVISKEVQENESQKKLDKKIENLALFLGKNDISISDLPDSDFFNLNSDQKIGKDFIVNIIDKRQFFPFLGPCYSRVVQTEYRLFGLIPYSPDNYCRFRLLQNSLDGKPDYILFTNRSVKTKSIRIPCTTYAVKFDCKFSVLIPLTKYKLEFYVIQGLIKN